MKAVILAAGEGARMGPFTASVPKVMIPVGNRPLLEYVVQALADNGVRDLIFIVGYRRERIQSHFQDGKSFGTHITYVTQTKQLGTAHAIWEARGHLEDPFIVLNGSNMVDGRFVEDLLAAAPKPAVLITQSERPQSYGVVTVRGRASDRRAMASSRSEGRSSSRSRRNRRRSSPTSSTPGPTSSTPGSSTKSSASQRKASTTCRAPSPRSGSAPRSRRYPRKARGSTRCIPGTCSA